MDISTYPQENLQHDFGLFTGAEAPNDGATVAERPAAAPVAAPAPGEESTTPDDGDEALINLIQGEDPEGEAVALSGLAVAIITETARDLMGPKPAHPDKVDGPLALWRRRDMLTNRKTRLLAIRWVRESQRLIDAWDESSGAYIFSLARCVELINAQLVARHGENTCQHSVKRLRWDLQHRPSEVVKAMGVRATRPDESEPTTGGGSMADRHMALKGYPSGLMFQD